MPASESSGAPAQEPPSIGPPRSPRLPVPALTDGDGRRFRPLFVVGRGGMGSIEVVVETTSDGVERVVARKRMLPTAVLDKRQTEMFLREAKLASMLSHPNVVHATSYGEHDGELFLVMEYIEGEPLSRIVAVARERRETLSLPVVAHVLAEICEGLHAAHELTDENGRPLNVVHRDISPQNVMVSYDGWVKLLDFGVAKIEALEDDGRTKTGEVKGKTAYMSPEQAMGESIDRRSDLYSLGAVLFEAISGQKMWGGGTDLEVLRRMALEEPPLLEVTAPGTPPAICRLHKRLVSRDPARRPATAREVADELRAFIASTGAHPDARVVRSLMTGLFAADIDRRRALLREALEKVATPGSEAVLASLHPIPPSDATPDPATRSRRGSPSAASWPTRTVAVLGVAGALALAVFWRRGEAVAPASPSAGAAVSVPGTEPAAAPAQPPAATAETAPPAEPAPSAAPKASGSPPLGPAAARPAPEASTRPAPKERPRPAGTSSPKPTGPLDVDPAPF